MVPLYDRPLWTLHWENKGLKEFHFLKKQNLESEICYAIDLCLKTKQDKTNTIPINSWITLVDSMKVLITGHICVWTTGMVSSGSHQGGDGHGTQGQQTWPSACCCLRNASSQLPCGFVKCIKEDEVNS